MGVMQDQDAFGRGMWAYYREGGSPLEIVERSDGFIAGANNTAGYFAAFDAWPRHQQEAISLATGSHALDVGCGAGRVSLHLQSKGMHVVAIDASPRAIRICRERGVVRARRMRLEDVARLRERFTTVILFGNNFGLFGSRVKAKRLLRTLYSRTSPDAVILAETTDPYRTANPCHLQYHTRNRARGRMSGQIRMRVRFQTVATPWFDYLLVSPQEMTDIVAGTGWSVVQFIGDAQPSYIGVLRKTGSRNESDRHRTPALAGKR